MILIDYQSTRNRNFYLTSFGLFDTVAKRKSLFNDRPTEIQELTYIIKEDIDCLRKEIGKLHEVANFQKQSQQNNGRHHLLSHSSSVVIALQSKLASMSSEFKQVLEVRTEVS